MEVAYEENELIQILSELEIVLDGPRNIVYPLGEDVAKLIINAIIKNGFVIKQIDLDLKEMLEEIFRSLSANIEDAQNILHGDT